MEDANSEVDFLFSKKAGGENWWNSFFFKIGWNVTWEYGHNHSDDMSFLETHAFLETAKSSQIKCTKIPWKLCAGKLAALLAEFLLKMFQKSVQIFEIFVSLGKWWGAHGSWHRKSVNNERKSRGSKLFSRGRGIVFFPKWCLSPGDGE